ncbi:MAG TPA: polysaccharide biosynthesis/export family protein [Polyangiaceae bacterium]|nr:polysaccharide biosynthesis/export family protein [Polyangiaceae bacterium]
MQSMLRASCHLLLFALSFIVVLGCGSPYGDVRALYAEAARNDPRIRPYVIGVSDVVRVTVWKDPNLSTDAAVRPDGTITLPLVGEVAAAGRTIAELHGKIAEQLSAFAKDAVVTVAVVEVNSYRFTVAGNVERPGMYTPRYYVTVSEAIALAAGPNRYASTGSMVIVRGTRRIPINYDAILSGKSPEQDVVVIAGDAVRVP